MRHALLGCIDLFVVLLFALGWWILERVAASGDRPAPPQADSARDARHPEGQ
jgi:hypothetical protein